MDEEALLVGGDSNGERSKSDAVTELLAHETTMEESRVGAGLGEGGAVVGAVETEEEPRADASSRNATDDGLDMLGVLRYGGMGLWGLGVG